MFLPVQSLTREAAILSRERITATTLHKSQSHRDECSLLRSSLSCLTRYRNSGRSSAPPLTSSQAGGYMSPTSVYSNGRLTRGKFMSRPRVSKLRLLLLSECGAPTDMYTYNCCWPSPAKSLQSPIPSGLRIIFYCLIQDSPNLEGQVPEFVFSRDSMATRRDSPNLEGQVPQFVFSRDSMATRRITAEVFEIAFSKQRLTEDCCPLHGCVSSLRTAQEALLPMFLHCCMTYDWREPHRKYRFQ
jgi:hypothetical protein